MGNRIRKGKRYIEGNNSGKYYFIPSNLNKEIMHIFNLTTHKEALVKIFMWIRYLQSKNL